MQALCVHAMVVSVCTNSMCMVRDPAVWLFGPLHADTTTAHIALITMHEAGTQLCFCKMCVQLEKRRKGEAGQFLAIFSLRG